MNRWISNALGLSAMGALLTLGWAGFEMGSAIRENRPAIQAATAGAQAALSPTGAGVPTVFNEARDITIAMLKPCKPGKPETCGLIPSVRSVAVSAGGAVDAMKTQVNQTQPLIEGAARAISDTSTHANTAIDAATDATRQARTDLETLNGTIAASRPLVEASTLAVQHFDALVQSPDLSAALGHVQGVTASADGIMIDARKVADKETADWLKPVPWWKAPLAKGGQLIDITAAIARHTP